MREIQGKSALVQVSARFESSGVNLVADPDLQIRGRPGHLDPEIRGGGAVSKKYFFGPLSLNLV